jgi:hypothetical protein
MRIDALNHFFDFHKAGKKKVLIKELEDGESPITR